MITDRFCVIYIKLSHELRHRVGLPKIPTCRKLKIMDWLLIGIVGAAIAIFAMVDLSLKSYTRKTRMIWYPIVILIPILGPALYYFMRRTLSRN